MATLNKFKGVQTTAGAGVFTVTDEGITVDKVLNTTGDGYWSNESLPVKINGVCLSYTDDEGKFGELQKLIESSQNSMTRIMIGTAGTVLTGILGLVVVVLQK